MELVHVFCTVDRFRTEQELRDFVDPSYTDDGDLLPSQFLREVALTHHEPACIETVHSDRPAPVRDLLSDASYADQWLPRLDPNRVADGVVCVFPPNRVGDPSGSSLTYLGAFTYVS